MCNTRKLAFALAALCLTLLTSRGAAASCRCGADSPVRACAAYWNAREVFTGVVTAVAESGVREGGSESRRPFNYKLVRLRVEETFRGPKRRVAETLTGPGFADCGYRFVKGRRYLVYAVEGADGRLYTSVCTSTKPLGDARADLSFMRGLASSPPLAAVYGNVEFSGRDLKDSSYRGEPAAGLRVVVEGGGVLREGMTDARGDFAFEGLPPGSYSVKPVYPEHARGYVDTTPFELRARQCKELGYAPWWDGRVGGKVLDARGTPVRGLRVWLVSAESDLSVRANLQHGMWEMTGEDGTFEFTNVPRGRYQLAVNVLTEDNPFRHPRAFHPGVEDRARATTIELGGGEWLTVPDFRLTRPHSAGAQGAP